MNTFYLLTINSFQTLFAICHCTTTNTSATIRATRKSKSSLQTHVLLLHLNRSFCLCAAQSGDVVHVASGRQVLVGLARPDDSPVGPASSGVSRPHAPAGPTGGQLRPGGPHIRRRHQLGHHQAVRSALVREGALLQLQDTTRFQARAEHRTAHRVDRPQVQPGRQVHTRLDQRLHDQAHRLVQRQRSAHIHGEHNPSTTIFIR